MAHTIDPDNTDPTTGEPIYTDFVDVGPELGDVDDDEYEREVERLDDCYTHACEGTPYTIQARPGQRGEARALYAETSHGLQILGGSVHVPEDVREIQEEAWQMYCDDSASADREPMASLETAIVNRGGGPEV